MTDDRRDRLSANSRGLSIRARSATNVSGATVSLRGFRYSKRKRRFLAMAGVVFFLLAGCSQPSGVQQDAAALATTQARTSAVQTQAAALQQLAAAEGQATNVAIAATVAASAVPVRAAATAQAAAAAGASLATQAAVGATATIVAGQVYANTQATAQVDRAGWRARRDAAAQYVRNCGLAAEIATRSTTVLDAISQSQKLNEATEAIKTCND